MDQDGPGWTRMDQIGRERTRANASGPGHNNAKSGPHLRFECHKLICAIVYLQETHETRARWRPAAAFVLART